METEYEDGVEAPQVLAVDRRGLLLKGGLAAAGVTMLGSPAAAFAAGASAMAGKTTKIAVVTHGDTGSFWSVFKAGVDQAAKDMKGRGVKVTQVYANNDVAKQVAGINAAIAAKVNVIATSVPDASALKGSLSQAAKNGIEIITVNSGEDAFDNVPAIQKTYMAHVGQDEEVAGEGAGKQFNAAGAKSVVVVIHEASNSGLTERAAGVKKTFKGKTSTLLIPNAKSDIPGTVAKVKAYFSAHKGTDALLGLDPDVTVPCISAAPKGAKIGTFDLNGDVIKNLESGKMLFAIDQQQYLQGYLPVVFAVLFVNNLNTVGGGKPILTGPGIVNRGNAAKVAALAKKGTR
ncbi:MAG: substrate-binding domain-containing protein [Gaiellaceae bacterium]